jgi:trehalose/maltose transport system permease protein
MKLLKLSGFYLFYALIVLYAVFPFYWAVNTSLQDSAGMFKVSFWPETLHWENYRNAFAQGFARNVGNSVIVALVTVALSLAIAVTAAYALSRIAFRGRKLLLFTILGVSMFPQVAILAGMYELMKALGLYNSLLGLTFSYMLFTLPFTVWVLTTFMRELPKELEEAALVDGASSWTIITRVFLPLLGPALVTTGLLAFIAAWNEFLFALTFTSSDDIRTVPVAIAMMSGASSYELPWNMIMAASVIVTIPIIGLVLMFQKKIVSGLTAGSVKG